MKSIDFEVIKIMEKLDRVNSPLLQMLNERWSSPDEWDESYLYTLRRIEEITQTILDLITAGLL
jgi:uncharacterized protein YfkK (UPF0435 family)